MLFLTHFLFGVLVAWFFQPFFPKESLFSFFCSVLLGCFLPDLDEKKSKITQWSGFLGKICSFLFKHRGFFHSVSFLILATGGMKLIAGTVPAGGLFLGLSSHFFLDILTKQGLFFFYPFSRIRLAGWIKVGGNQEKILQFFFFVLLVFLVLRFFLF